MVLAAFIGAASTHAQEAAQSTPEFSYSGSVRLRQEAISGQLRAGFNNDDTLTSLRTRLYGRYGTDRLFAEAELYDSRAYLYDAQTPVGTGEVNAAELVQASLTARFDLAEHIPLQVQAGRFTLNLGSRRLVASDDYRNTTNGYTGVRLDAGARTGAVLTAIYTMPQERLPDDRPGIDRAAIVRDREGPDAVLWGAVGSIPLGFPEARLEGTAIAFREKDSESRPSRDRDLKTVGLRYFRDPKPGQADFDAELYLQTGRASASLSPEAALQDVRAAFVHLEAGWQGTGAWKPRIAAEFDHASGDQPGGDFNRFDTLFGMRRAEIAPAGLYNAVGRANLLSPGLRIEAAPDGRTDVFVTWRGLWLASRTDAFSTTGLRDSAGLSGRFAGHQVDARLRRWLVPDRLRIEINTVMVAHGEFLKSRRPGRDDPLTLYGGIDLTASF